jgi:hypothetical protein
MFQNSVLTVFHSESDPHTDTTRWGENEQVEETATDSDHEEHTAEESKTEHNNETQEKGEYYKEETIYEKANEETKTLEQIVETMNRLPDNHYVWGYADPTRVYYTYEQGEKWEDTTNDEYQHKRDFIQWYDCQLQNMAEMKAMQMLMGYYDELTECIEANDQEVLANLQAETKPEIEKEGTKEEHVNVELTTDYAKTENLNQLSTTDNKTQPLKEAANTKEEAEGSSSVEPEWGRFTKQNGKEIEEDYHTWKTANVGGYENQRTTQAYRHGRCYICSKPVSTTNLDSEVRLWV